MTMRGLAFFFPFLFIASAGCRAEQQPSTADMDGILAEVQASHISANAPPDASFMMLLQRDVQSHLIANQFSSKSVEIELLRNGPTQTGMSFPKYYIWIRAVDEAGHQIEGVMRVASIDQTRFEITDFTRETSILSDPTSLASTYPAVLIPAIRQHAGFE